MIPQVAYENRFLTGLKYEQKMMVLIADYSFKTLNRLELLDTIYIYIYIRLRFFGYKVYIHV